MKLNSISFKNYKAFSEKQTMLIRPITVLIGKNSSGKSSIAKLFTMFENSLSQRIDEPLLLKNNGVEIGGEFDNLFSGNKVGGVPLSFAINFEDISIEVSLFKKDDEYGLYIQEWNYTDKERSFRLELNNKGYYFDFLSSKEYKIEYKGFIPVKFQDCISGKDLIDTFKFNTLDVDYIGPFRVLPQRYFYLSGQRDFINTGVTGHNAYDMLGVSSLNDNSTLHKNVGYWYKKHFDGWELKVNSRSKKPLVEILLSKNDTDVNITDVGQGMNQALPLVVRSHIKRENSIVVLEQPELHLHPAAHGDLAELFAKSAIENNQKFIIETHSENILLRLRRLIVENTDFKFSPNDIIIYWIEDAQFQGQELREITIDKYGVLSDWPMGVFNENIKEIFAIDKALKNKTMEL